MLTFLALVAAVVALVIARKARAEVRELRREIDLAKVPVADAAAPPPIQRPAAAPAPTAMAPVTVALEPEAPQPPPPPPPPPVIPPYQPPPANAQARAWNIDWENLVGVRLFSGIAGVALVLAAVFLFKYSVEHGWLRPAVRATFGFVTGIALLLACELRVARNYRFTANAMDGAGIAILYATLFALYGRWHLWPAPAAFFGMLLVTAAAVYLSTRRDSIFIALLGLVGGFATPALLSSGENRPVALFSYLLLLNGGISWIAWKKRWPLLTALSLGLTAIYQWTWVERFLTTGQLPLAAAIFLLFAAVGASSLWPQAGEDKTIFRRIAAAGAVLPLLFAFFTAIVPEYGARSNVLFAFLFLVAAGLAAISLWRGPEWMHRLGGASVLLTFFIWLTVSYTPASWPLSLAWLGAFVALYLGVAARRMTPAVYAAPLLFFVFIGLALREEMRFLTLTGAMLALLAVVVVFALFRAEPWVGAIAVGLSAIASMTLDRSPGWLLIATQSALFATLLAIAWISGQHRLAVLAIPLSIAALASAERLTDPEQLLLGVILYALFIAYPLSLRARVGRSMMPHLAAVLASTVFFVHVYEMRDSLGFAEWAGALPLLLSIVLIALMRLLLELEPMPSRLALVGAAALAFLTAVAPVQLEKEWITIAWAVEAAALVWLFRRVPHRGLLAWSGALSVAVVIRLVLNPAVFDYHPKSATPILNWYLFAYLVSAIAMFVAAWLAPETERIAKRVGNAAGALILFVLLNIEIADFYSTGESLTFNFFSSSLAQELTYTFGWALFAMAMLVAGIVLHSRSARVAALGLLVVTIAKCFLHDLARLGGLYRVASLFGLAVSLVLVGLLLQKFVMMKRGPQPPAADGLTP
jgi:uncharacterized membrane protein